MHAGSRGGARIESGILRVNLCVLYTVKSKGSRRGLFDLAGALQVLKRLFPIEWIKHQVRYISRGEAILPQEALVDVGHVIHLIAP